MCKSIQWRFVCSHIFVKWFADYTFSMTLYGGKNLNLEISSMIVPESDKLDGLVSSNAATIVNQPYYSLICSDNRWIRFRNHFYTITSSIFTFFFQQSQIRQVHLPCFYLFLFLRYLGRGTWRIGKDSGIPENGRFCGNEHNFITIWRNFWNMQSFLKWKKVLDSTKCQISIPHFKFPFRRKWRAHDFLSQECVEPVGSTLLRVPGTYIPVAVIALALFVANNNGRAKQHPPFFNTSIPQQVPV